MCPAHNVWSSHRQTKSLDKYISELRQIHYEIFLVQTATKVTLCVPTLPECVLHTSLMHTTMHIIDFLYFLNTFIAVVASYLCAIYFTCESCTMSGNFVFNLDFNSLQCIVCVCIQRFGWTFFVCFLTFSLFVCFPLSPYMLVLYRTATKPSEKFLHILFVLFHFVRN